MLHLDYLDRQSNLRNGINGLFNYNVSTRERVIDWGYWRILITK